MPDELAKVFPYYLSHASKDELRKRIEGYPNDRNFFATSWDGPAEPLQGDGWNGFIKIDFQSGTRIELGGIVISNSCDIDPQNRSISNRNIIFAPIIALDDYAARLRGLSSDKVSGHLDAIRTQQKTDLFYLPASKRTPEAVVRFDDISSQPLSVFVNYKDRERLFRLNTYGFYVFLMKVSIHFTRFGEALDRQ
ncbi:hypothetical protein [Mesorhizobium sp. B2-8-5]|uniref:hypothetical protein n=1 Tax=Mesorhizobium sp. B2-8-5 TaxID=2589903 RepID=UPI0011295F86|nr:hypothetical protein [Mesorhizobium sp. B2-8-5]UCI24613.1 hypothetical protein FJ430_23910 [Mesorhizobium sp. B2-8-5]